MVRAMRLSFRTAGPALAFAFALSGCGLYNNLFGGPPKLSLGQVRVLAEADANRNSPVVLDVVLVADAAIEQRLMSPEIKWFPQGPALVTSYPGALQVYRCEFPPASEMSLPASMFDGQRALAVIVFAGLADGERRARIESWRDGGQITIGREGWAVAPQAKGRAPPRSPPAMHCSSQA
jgi:hypothetical protein